jgi:short-subunit dehydrogenase
MIALVIGASSGVGRALAYRLAEAGYDLVLVARDSIDLTATARDAAIRFGVRAVAIAADVDDPDWLNEVQRTTHSLGRLDVLAMPVGTVAEHDDPVMEEHSIERLMRVNFLAIMNCVQCYWGEIERQRGTIIGFGSIAATRGRSRNAAYSAAKSALQSWFESLRHFAIDKDVRVQFYVPGYLNTSLAYGMSVRLPKADPDDFAKHVVRNLGKDFGVRYYPHYWRYLCTALRLTPWRIYRCLRF